MWIAIAIVVLVVIFLLIKKANKKDCSCKESGGAYVEESGEGTGDENGVNGGGQPIPSSEDIDIEGGILENQEN